VPRRAHLLLFVALALFAIAAVVVASRVDPRHVGATIDTDHLPVIVTADKVPDAGGASGWLNSPPLTAADLKGKVVLYDFWTYACVNCVRALPHVRAWYATYRADGLVVIGIHSPEFAFEKDPDNVARAVKALKVDWPVALDPDHRIWDAFGNQYWPAKYVLDRDGRLRYYHFGEGNYDETEDVLRSLLGVAKSAPRAREEADTETAGNDQTAETYLGSLHGQSGLVSPEKTSTNGSATYTVPADLRVDKYALDGPWEITDEYAVTGAASAAIVLHYRGTEVNLVMAAPAEAVDVTVELDGARQAPVTVAAADLYNVVDHGPKGDHTLRLTASGAGLEAFAFTFGSG
jgi:thiol-disulfide isomerase/thioredoxin